MKKILFTLTILIVSGASLTGCTGKATDSTEKSNSGKTTVEKETSILPAIDRYLVTEFGKSYSKGDYCVPCYSIVATDESKADDILAWGDFWVFNYNLMGDTLKTVSGGSHPGLMHLRQTENGYAVTAFEQVEDGSNYLPTAKRIFGDKYEAFHAINSNDQKREQVRAETLAKYVKTHNLPATMYQDYGWPAIKLPQQ